MTVHLAEHEDIFRKGRDEMRAALKQGLRKRTTAQLRKILQGVHDGRARGVHCVAYSILLKRRQNRP